MSKEEFKDLKEKSLHETDSILPIFIIDPITTRLIYWIKKKNINITPNEISSLRLFYLYPIVLLFLFLAPLFQERLFYPLSALLIYIALVTDGLDGQLARALDKKSTKGFFYDLIGDRCNIIIFVILIFSFGMFFSDPILIYGSILVFTLKSFHLMVITKVYFLSPAKTEEQKEEIFGPNNALDVMGINSVYRLIAKTNKFLRIKRWDGAISGPERYVITMIIPCVLAFYPLFDKAIIYAFYLFTLAFSVFFLLRIISLLKASFAKFDNE